MNKYLLPKILISVLCVAAVLVILLRGDETPTYDGDMASAGEGEVVDGFLFDPEELTYDGNGELDLLEGVSLPGVSTQELKKIVYVKIQTAGALSSKRVEYTAETGEGRYRSVRKMHLSGYTGPKITMPEHIPEVTPDTINTFDRLLASEEDFFVDDGFGNDLSAHMEVELERSRQDSSQVSYTVSIENVFGDRNLATCDVTLSGEYPVIALTDAEVVLRRGQTFDPAAYIARAEKPDGTPAMDEVMVRGRVDTTTPGSYAMTYVLMGETVELSVVVE